MPTWFKTRSYTFDRSIDPDSDPADKEGQECGLTPTLIDLEQISSFEKIRKFNYQNDFGDIGGTLVRVGLSVFAIETRYENFCKIMELYIGKPIDETCLITVPKL